MFSGITAVHVRFDRLFFARTLDMMQRDGFTSGFEIRLLDFDVCQNIFCVRAESSWRTFQLLCMFTLQLEFVLKAFSV